MIRGINILFYESKKTIYPAQSTRPEKPELQEKTNPIQHQVQFSKPHHLKQDL